jgi:hypothetical protein
MSHISKLLDNNSKSEILLSDIKDYAIIPLGFLDYRRNAFIYITNLIRSFSTFIIIKKIKKCPMERKKIREEGFEF